MEQVFDIRHRYFFTDVLIEGNCQAVPLSLSTTAQGSIDGYWAGAENFSDNLGTYLITLNDVNVNSDAEFKTFMNDVFYDGFLAELGEKSKNQTLVENLMYWYHFHFVATTGDAGTDEQIFEFMGIPASIFDVKYRLVGLASAHHHCRSYANTAWNIVLGVVEVSFNVTDYYLNHCDDILHPALLGYNAKSYRNGNGKDRQFKVSMDLTSLTGAVSFNFGLIPYEVLRKIVIMDDVYFRGVQYEASLMVSFHVWSMNLLMVVLML
jgi:hypothetical protein